MTPELRQKILDLRSQGLSYRLISEALGGINRGVISEAVNPPAKLPPTGAKRGPTKHDPTRPLNSARLRGERKPGNNRLLPETARPAAEKVGAGEPAGRSAAQAILVAAAATEERARPLPASIPQAPPPATRPPQKPAGSMTYTLAATYVGGRGARGITFESAHAPSPDWQKAHEPARGVRRAAPSRHMGYGTRRREPLRWVTR